MAQTHFGYQTVDEADKASRVRGVFDSVATRYDVMNDVLSFGLHRAWKAFTVAVADVRPGMQVLDIAGGTGDLARAFARRAGPTGRVVLSKGLSVRPTAGSRVYMRVSNSMSPPPELGPNRTVMPYAMEPSFAMV